LFLSLFFVSHSPRLLRPFFAPPPAHFLLLLLLLLPSLFSFFLSFFSSLFSSLSVFFLYLFSYLLPPHVTQYVPIKFQRLTEQTKDLP
jgi:hypothetical protein